LRERGTMVKQDLRELVGRQIDSGYLVEISEPVDVDHELASVAHAAEERLGLATLFRNLPGYPDASVLSGIALTYERVADALEVELPHLKRKMLDALAEPLPPSHNQKDPLERSTSAGDDVDLFKVPIPTHAPQDAGPYVTAGIVAARDPETGRMNYSYHRMLRLDRNHLTIMINPGRHLDDYRLAAQKVRQTMPVVVFIGVHPAIMLAAAMRCPGDELEIAGRLLDQPIETIPYGQEKLPVPVFSEYILEGVVDLTERVEEGPMGEFTGIYGPKSQEYLLEITRISFRPRPIYQTILPAGKEHKVFGATLPREPVLLQAALGVSPEVKDVYIPPYGSGLLAVVVFDPTYQGQAKNVALAALSAYTTIKSVIVVNSDIDIHNAEDLLWAVCTRADLQQDLALLPHFLGHPLDPAAVQGLVTKSIIDATQLPGQASLDRVAYEHPVDLDRYLPPET
jgi:2,5-furandicarboxylate decarboxylase 1